MKLKEAEVTKEEYIQKIKKLKEKLSNILPTLDSIIEVNFYLYFLLLYMGTVAIPCHISVYIF